MLAHAHYGVRVGKPHTHAHMHMQGKAAARQALRQRLGLTGWGDKFIVAVVGASARFDGILCDWMWMATDCVHWCAERLQRRGNVDHRLMIEYCGLQSSCGWGWGMHIVLMLCASQEGEMWMLINQWLRTVKC